MFILLQPLPVSAQALLGSIANPVKEGSAPAVQTQATSVSADELKKRLRDTQAELAAIDSLENLASGAPPGTPKEQLQLRTRMLRLMAFSYRQHMNALDSLAEQQKFFADAETKRLALSDSPEKPPYSVRIVDSLRAELQSALLDLRSEEARLKILAAQMESAKESLDKASERARLAQEKREASKQAELPVADWRLNLAALEVRAQGAYLESLMAMRQSIEAGIVEFNRAVDYARRKLGEAEKSATFLPEDLERLKSDIDERRSKTIKALDSATQERERVSAEVDKAIERDSASERQVLELERRLAEARKGVSAAEAEMAKAGKPDSLLQKVNPFRGRSEKADLEKRRKESVDLQRQLTLARDTAKSRKRELLLSIERNRNAVQVVESLNVELTTLDMQWTFWELRYAAYADRARDGSSRSNTVENSRRLLKVLNPAIELLRSKLEIIVGQIAEQQGSLRTAEDGGEIAFRKTMITLLTERERSYLAATAEVEEVRHLLLRWLEEEDLRSGGLTAGERARNWLSLIRDGMKAAWTFELFAVEDSIVVDGRTITGTRGVTVAKVVNAILIVVIGYLLIALLTRFIIGSAVRHGRMEETSARIARKWILAVTLVILLVLALDVVKIPLTAFAFLGGAIAIGAGFGMQTLLKNLISGVMLLMERPFKPRDIIEVGGIRGEVTDINVRSCTIRDVNGIETLVPNSTFLEQNVTNWTLSNHKVRYTLNIGVGYGSPVRKVSDLLLEAASRHKQVLDDPAPEVLFMDFGDNALMFTLYVWLEVGPGRRGGNVILSDLRFMIDTSFAEHGIEIPFPQRDVHLDAGSPLPVRIVPGE